MLRKLFKDEKGSAILETAITMPLILLLVFGFMSIMNGANHTSAMRRAANEAAREYAAPIADTEGNPVDMKPIAIAKAYSALEKNGVKGAVVKAYEDGKKKYIEIEKPFVARLPKMNLNLKAGAVYYEAPVDPEFEE